MHLASVLSQTTQSLGQRYAGAGKADATQGSSLAEAGLGARPNNVVHGHVVAIDGGLTRRGVHHGSQIGLVEAEEIEECAVLTESVGVVGVVKSRLCITQNNDEAIGHGLCQTLAALDIYLLLKHIVRLLSLLCWLSIWLTIANEC